MKELHRNCRPGEVIFREGDAPDTAYLIERGTVEVTSLREGRAVLLGRLGPGDLLGEMAVLDAEPRSATATAVDDVTLLVIDREQFAERLAGADPVLRGLVEGLLRRFRAALTAMRGEESEIASTSARIEGHGIDKIRLETQLRAALESRGLDVRYQPLLEIAGGRIAGYEALVRWTHPGRGPVSPAEFIALAEETSLIVPVGEYVFDAACALLVSLRAAGREPLPFIAVNVSARQLAHPGLIERVLARMDAVGLPHRCLKVEITESRMLDYEQVTAVIAHCHALGIAVALDDFGTGYSHLTHLHRLAFDTVKIDQAFTRSMLEDGRSMAIVRAIVAMAQALDADIVAEGVETEAQLQALRDLGCHYAQGWLVGKPQLADEVLATG